MTPLALAQTLPGFVLAGVLGLVVGSFLNVVIHRLPNEKSVVSPPSSCPACGSRIAPRDNVPVLSWIALGGRCRSCRAPIAVRYPLVELANGALWVLVLRAAPTWGDAATGAFLVSASIALLAIDIDEGTLPDKITLPGIVVGLGLSFFSVMRTPLNALLGALVGATVLFLLRYLYEKVTGLEGMGLGDVKMLGMMGANLGLAGALVGTFVASITGSVVGAWILWHGGDRKKSIPFGPFLAIGAVFSWFFGRSLIASYLAMWPR